MTSEERPEQRTDAGNTPTRMSGSVASDNESVLPDTEDRKALPEEKIRAESKKEPEGLLSEVEVAELLKQSQRATPDYVGDIGDIQPNEKPDVDIILHPSRDLLIAGELWSIIAEIHNRSLVTIWIIDTKTALSLAPEMYGLVNKTGSQFGYFSTISNRPEDEVVRIDPGAKYSVIWKIDPASVAIPTLVSHG